MQTLRVRVAEAGGRAAEMPSVSAEGLAMKECSRCGEEYDNEKVVCPACMNLMARRRLERQQRYWPKAEAKPYTADIEFIQLRDGTRIPVSEDSRTVYLDFNGIEMTQDMLDFIVSVVNAEPAYGGTNIFIRRMSSRPMPRLIADRGEIYDQLVELVKGRRNLA